MQKKQRTFTREFKVEAVQLAKTSGKPMIQIARDLGIADSTLHNWCKEFSEHGSQAFAFEWTSNPTRRGNSPAQTRE